MLKFGTGQITGAETKEGTSELKKQASQYSDAEWAALFEEGETPPETEEPQEA